MDAPRTTVKATRSYDSSRRREQARQRRAHVLAIAERHLLRFGYGATTVPAVAAAAGVSAETIYKAYGGKRGLVRAIQQAALEGSGNPSAPARSDALSGDELDPDRILRGWADLSAEVAPRVAPIMLLVRAAASGDADMAGLLTEMTEARMRRMTHNARRLYRTEALRPGVTVTMVRDVLLAFSSPELFEILVLQRGWSLPRYADFVYLGIRGELLP